MDPKVIHVQGVDGPLVQMSDTGPSLSPWDAVTLARKLLVMGEGAWGGEHCRYCPAPVQFARTVRAGGKTGSMPMDIGEHPAGNMAGRWHEGALWVRFWPADKPLEPGDMRLMTHFATCPRADEARKPKDRGTAGKAQ